MSWGWTLVRVAVFLLAAVVAAETAKTPEGAKLRVTFTIAACLAMAFLAYQ